MSVVTRCSLKGMERFAIRALLICCVAACLPSGMTLSHAEVIELEGTVKALDADARTISIERKTAKGTKTLDLEVAKKAGDLGAMKVGDPITFSYDPGLELVTKIGQGTSDANAPTAMPQPIDELNTAGTNVNPSLTANGLVIVWQSGVSDGTFICKANRETLATPFTNPVKLCAGFNPVISADGGSVIFYNPQTSAVSEVRRKPRSNEFDAPKPASGLAFRAYPSGMTADGLTLYVDMHPPQIEEGSSPAHIVKRDSQTARWQQPVPIKVAVEAKLHSYRVMGACPLPGDESQVACILFTKDKPDSGEVAKAVLLSELHGDTYRQMAPLNVLNGSASADPDMKIFNPRFNPATRELVFQSSLAGRGASNAAVGLWMVKDYDPAAVHKNQ